MGLFDDMTALLGRGMDAADKKSQEFKLQAELNRLASGKEKALAELGRAVLAQEGAKPAFVNSFAEEIKAIGDFEAQEESLRRQIEALQNSDTLVSGVTMQAASAVVQGHACPACGSPVALESMFCPACGDNLAKLKAQFRICPNCNVYYPSSSAFCEKCGSRTANLEVAASFGMPSTEGGEAVVSADNTELTLEVEAVPDAAPPVSLCPHCGAALMTGDVFCSSCGEQL